MHTFPTWLAPRNPMFSPYPVSILTFARVCFMATNYTVQNVLNGGSHAGGRLAFQEFMIVPS